MIPDAIFAETLWQFLAPIRGLLDDPAVSDICLNGPRRVFVERAGRLELTEARFETGEHLASALRNLAQFVGKQVDAERPILEARLPDGSRVEAALGAVSEEIHRLSYMKTDCSGMFSVANASLTRAQVRFGKSGSELLETATGAVLEMGGS